MNLSKQIKHFRNTANFSQEELAEKMYVSRQSISNWENERSYPDIHNLLMLSAIFDVSLDELVKGDVEMMKSELQQSNIFKWVYMMMAGMIVMPLSIAPVIRFFGMAGLFIPLLLFVITMVAAYRVESVKKKNQLKTYRQIVDFLEGKPIRKAAVSKKDFLFKGLLVVTSGVVSFILVYMSMTLFKL